MARAGLTTLLFILTTMAWAATKLGPAHPTDQDRIQGTWQIVSVSRGGESDDMQVDGLVTFAADTVVFGPSLAAVNTKQVNAIDLAAFS
jgi:hypothetical protein